MENQFKDRLVAAKFIKYNKRRNLMYIYPKVYWFVINNDLFNDPFSFKYIKQKDICEVVIDDKRKNIIVMQVYNEDIDKLKGIIVKKFNKIGVIESVNKGAILTKKGILNAKTRKRNRNKKTY